METTWEKKKYSFTDAVRFQTFGARPSNIDLLTMSLYLLSEMVCFMWWINPTKMMMVAASVNFAMICFWEWRGRRGCKVPFVNFSLSNIFDLAIKVPARVFTLIFNRCHHSWDAAMLVKYKRDIQYSERYGERKLFQKITEQSKLAS